MPDYRIDKRVIWLTGASGHLGQAMAEALVSAGAHVILSGRRADKLNALAARLQSPGGATTVLAFDIEIAEQRENAARKIAKEIGRLDGIVNNAYAGRTGTVESATREDFEKAGILNLYAPFHLMQLSLPLLKEAGKRNIDGAAIVNVASMYGIVSPDPEIYGTSGSNSPPFYGSTKAGLIQLSRYLACHLAPSNIRVNSVSPGAFPHASILTDQPEFHADLCSKAPMGRIGAATEVAGPRSCFF